MLNGNVFRTFPIFLSGNACILADSVLIFQRLCECTTMPIGHKPSITHVREDPVRLYSWLSVL